MEISKVYGDMVRKKIASNPNKAEKMIRVGLRAEELHKKFQPDKEMPDAYRFLNYHCIKSVAEQLAHPEKSVWCNIFAPVEILQAFDLRGMSMECLSSILSGFYLEDYFIDEAENEGIASTLCSYHKNFIGAVTAGVIPKPVCGITTSMICDGNINTFRYLEEREGVENYILDVPHEWSKESEQYLVAQLKEMIAFLEKKTGKQFSEEKLREIIRRENKSKAHLQSFLTKRMKHNYPNTLTMMLFMLFASHLDIGSEWALEFFEKLDADIEKYPESKEKRIFWIHLTPYAQDTLRHYLNCGEDYAVSCDDFNLDYIEELDENHPLESLAKKMINNIYNGDFERKAEAVASYIKKYECDAVIEFCHWGCKQSSGGVQLMKEKVRQMGIPMLILDGDALDRRNIPDGQIKTRFEAFLELMN